MGLQEWGAVIGLCIIGALALSCLLLMEPRDAIDQAWSRTLDAAALSGSVTYMAGMIAGGSQGNLLPPWLGLATFFVLLAGMGFGLACIGRSFATHPHSKESGIVGDV